MPDPRRPRPHDRPVVLILSANDVGQIRDGLEARADQWDATARFLATGEIDPDHPVCECSHPDEAANLAAWYRRLIATLDDALRPPEGR